MLWGFIMGFNLLGKYNDLNIGRKLVIIFILISIIPITVLQGFYFSIVRQQMTDQVDEIIYNDLIQISQRANLSIDNYTNILYQIYVDDGIINQIEMLTSDTDSKRVAAKSEIRNKLHQSTSVVQGVRCISLVCSNGESLTYDFTTDSSIFHLWSRFSDMRISPPYQDSVGKPGMVITPTMKFNDNGKPNYYLHISKRMFDFDHLDKGTIATIIMTIDEDVLDSICNTSDASAGVNFIVSKEGKVISFPDKAYIAANVGNDMESFVRETGVLNDCRKIGFNTYEDESTGWIFVNAYDRDEMLKEVSRIQNLTLLISLSILILVILVILYTTRTFNTSVQEILTGMKMVQEGNLDKQIAIKNKDEFGTIATNFNLMTTRVKELLSEVASAKDRQREAELKALEAQINPHFLYNTLDSINWMAIEKGENEISKAISNLGLILRHSVSKVDETTTVNVEKDFLLRYLELQTIRYEGAFSYDVKVLPETESLSIHKLLIQPFVENAIIHGFEGIEEGGLLVINIDLSENQEFLQISIADNGKGFPRELLEIINEREKVLDPEYKLEIGLGLQNAFTRLYMYYGEAAHWNINSVPQIGTEITLYIPRKECM